MSSRAGPSMEGQSAHAKSIFRNNLRGEDAYSRHQRYVRDYVQVYGDRRKGNTVEAKTDFDVLKAAHRFIRDENEDLSKLPYADQLAVKYYSSLFKEFVICDLKHYKSGAIALRWRTDTEVVDGIGQFTCANPRCAYHAAPAPGREGRMPKLTAYELPFSYIEDDKRKDALVKAVLCPRCAKKLVWKREKDRKEREERERAMPTVLDDDEPREAYRPRTRTPEEESEEEADYTPARPPDLQRNTRGRSRSPPRRDDRKPAERRSLS